LRPNHDINFLFFTLLIRSGIQILADLTRLMLYRLTRQEHAKADISPPDQWGNCGREPVLRLVGLVKQGGAM
jgi:hypothetical protein